MRRYSATGRGGSARWETQRDSHNSYVLWLAEYSPALRMKRSPNRSSVDTQHRAIKRQRGPGDEHCDDCPDSVTPRLEAPASVPE